MKDRFISSDSYKLLSEKNFTNEMLSIEQKLERYSNKGYVKSFDGNKLSYEYYLVKNPKANIVISHGFTEFAGKYHELTWYFLCMGYSVFTLTYRGHGESYRKLSDPELTHVDNFEDYVKDLDCFIKAKVMRNSEGKDIYLFSHSMGGAVAALYMEQHKGVIKKAVLSSPMFCPSTRWLPTFMAFSGVKLLLKRMGAEQRFIFSKGFDSNPPFSDACDTSEPRFRYHLNSRITNDLYKNSAFTNKWLYESFMVRKRIFRGGEKNIDADVLVFSAEKDNAIKNEYHKPFVDRLRNGTHITVKNAKHEIFSSTNDVLDKYLKQIFEFFAK